MIALVGFIALWVSVAIYVATGIRAFRSAAEFRLAGLHSEARAETTFAAFCAAMATIFAILAVAVR